MVADEEGFLYPSVDAIRCVDCGVCLMTCPATCPVAPLKGVDPRVYAAWSLNEETRYQSTSGGVFTELAKAILRDGGIAAGVRYDKQHRPSHTLIRCEDDLPLLRQSKYAQSDTGDIYRNVRAALDRGKEVLFVGTPCQCAAIKHFVGPSGRLVVCDFICRGVNSPLVYAKYLEELEIRYGASVQRVWFKNKAYGWNRFGTQIDFENGQTYFGGRDEDPFMFGYIKTGLNLYMRPSCGQCAFKGIVRSTDVTLGDFWGVKLCGSDDNTQNGVSAVITHTEAGRRLFDSIAPRIYREEQELDAVCLANACLTEPAVADAKNRVRFWEAFRQAGFHEAINQFLEEKKND